MDSLEGNQSTLMYQNLHNLSNFEGETHYSDVVTLKRRHLCNAVETPDISLLQEAVLLHTWLWRGFNWLLHWQRQQSPSFSCRLFLSSCSVSLFASSALLYTSFFLPPFSAFLYFISNLHTCLLHIRLCLPANGLKSCLQQSSFASALDSLQ